MEGVKDPPPGKIQPRDLEAFCMEAMRRAGLGEEDARLTARVFVTTDTWGTFTHGSRQIRGLLRNARRGRVGSESARGGGCGRALLGDRRRARDGMPPAISHRSMQRAITQGRKQSGLGYVGIRRSSHFGAAGFYANTGSRAEHAGAVDVQRGTLHDRAGRARQGSGNKSHRLCGAGGQGSAP